MKVMVFGTFDILHPGHLNFFKQAKCKGIANFSSRRKCRLKPASSRYKLTNFSLYPKLIVVVARDVNVKKAKGHWPKFSEKIRLRNVKKLKIVNKAILGNKKDYFKVIRKEKPDVICLGYDQKIKVLTLKKELKKLGLKSQVFRLKAYKPHLYKSSKLKINYLSNI